MRPARGIESVIAIFCLAQSSLVCAPASRWKKLSRDEISIYELLLSKYPGELIVDPELLDYQSSDPEVLWKDLGSYKHNFHTPIPLLKSHRAAFDNMVSMEKLKMKIRSWNPKIRVGKSTQRERRRRDPITTFRFTPIGFDPNCQVAIVIRGGQQGPRAGDGICFILKKTDSGWNIENELNLWVS
jgi:hypothetical protein